MTATSVTRRAFLCKAVSIAAGLGISRLISGCSHALPPAAAPNSEPECVETMEMLCAVSSPAVARPVTSEPDSTPQATVRPSATATAGPASLRWGFDDAGGPTHFEQTAWNADCIREFGFDTWIHHYVPQPTVEGDRDQIQRIDAWCERNGVRWLANLESANWIAEHHDSLGREWYNRVDGRQYFQFPDDLLHVLGGCSALQGLLYDEAEHMQNSRHVINQIHKPFFYIPDGHELVEAADGLTSACQEIVAHHARYGLKLYTESVFPVMLSCFARAGMTAAPKILKEGWSPAYYAVALGAALQYGSELWITPDLWGLAEWHYNYPGHSVDEYRSALLMAYSLGADCVYTENLAYDHLNLGRGSLIRTQPYSFDVTEYGAVARSFMQEYVPANPRFYRWQNARPRTAIIRQEDGCWGQRTSWLPDILMGNHHWHSDDVTEGWLRVFHLLSRGVIPPYALSWHNTTMARTMNYQVFCPLDGVVVYDHHVHPELLRGLEVIFLTGIGISQETLSGVRDAVLAGATCIGRPALLPEDIRAAAERGIVAEGAGRWLASESFLDEGARLAASSVIPREDVLRYQFGETVVTLRPIEDDPNRLEVDIR